MEFALTSLTGGVPRVLDRRISNAGRMADIRKRDPQQIFTTGGIPKYSMMGSQNAISYVPIAYKTDSSTQTDKEKKDAGTGTDARPLLGTTQSEASKKAAEERKSEGLLGTTQSEASKTAMGVRKIIQDEKELEKKAKEEAQARKEQAVAPSNEPPYYLPSEQEDMVKMVQYIKDKYDENVGYELERESKAFSESVEKAKAIGRAIIEWRQKDLGQEWMLNQLKQVGKWVLGKATELAKDKVDIPGKIVGTPATELVKAGLDELKKVIEAKVLNEEHYEDTMRAIQNALFAARPYWKEKWDTLVAAETARVKKDFIDYLKKTFGPSGTKGDGNPMGYMSKKKEAPAPETEPKKRKLRKAEPKAEVEPKTYPKTKEGVKQYKADHPTASQRAIAEALGMAKTTVLRYLK